MKSTFITIILMFSAIGCGQKTSETQTSSTNTPIDSGMTVHDTIQSNNEELKPSTDDSKVDEVLLDESNLIKFSFVTKYAHELIFSDSGKVTISGKPGGDEKTGTWSISESSIRVAFGSDTASFQVESFKEDELVLQIGDNFGSKLFNYGSYSGPEYISLYRVIFSAPYPQAQVVGGWQAREGGCGFSEDGVFAFGAADCDVSGEWEFDGEYLSIKITEENCGWSDPFDTRLQVLRLSRGLMIVRNSKGSIEIFTR